MLLLYISSKIELSREQRIPCLHGKHYRDAIEQTWTLRLSKICPLLATSGYSRIITRLFALICTALSLSLSLRKNKRRLAAREVEIF